MTVTRRTFLRSGAVTALVTGLALDSIPRTFAQQTNKHNPAQDFQVSSEAKQEPTISFKRETFQPYLNGAFTLSAGPSSVAATLVSVRDCTPTTKSKVTGRSLKTDSFALVFRSEGKLADLTTIYDVEHATLGKFPLFLSRREHPRGTFFYEAVFNHTL
jgi:hypothetical protein